MTPVICKRGIPHMSTFYCQVKNDYIMRSDLEFCYVFILHSLAAVVVDSCSEFRPAGCVQVLAGLSDVSSSHAKAVLNVLKGRWEEIRHALLDRTNSISSATLQDFDWQLKLALSSDKISSLQTPLLSLSLDVRENGALQPITVEMNREELNTLISSLEAANKD
ncbi:hypothetical protein PAMP_006435 [Pampus punctatissimus]